MGPVQPQRSFGEGGRNISRDQNDMIAGFDAGRGTGAKECGQPLETRMGKEVTLPWSLQKEHNRLTP